MKGIIHRGYKSKSVYIAYVKNHEPHLIDSIDFSLPMHDKSEHVNGNAGTCYYCEEHVSFLLDTYEVLIGRVPYRYKTTFIFCNESCRNLWLMT